MFGEARETGATYQNASGPTFYEYTCCASGDNTGPACGDNDGSGWIGGGQWAHASNITIGYCVDTSGAALSSSGKSCDDASLHAAANWSDWLGDGRERLGYDGWSAWSWCGLEDDDDFTASTMCCACGGGETAANGSKTRAVWEKVADRAWSFAAGAWDHDLHEKIPYVHNAWLQGLTTRTSNADREDGTTFVWARYEDPVHGDACYAEARSGRPRHDNENQFKECPAVCQDSIGFGSPAAVRSRRHWNWLTKKGSLLFQYDDYDERFEYKTMWLGLTDVLVEGSWKWMNGWTGEYKKDKSAAWLPWLGNAPDVRTAPSPPPQHATTIIYLARARRSRAESLL